MSVEVQGRRKLRLWEIVAVSVAAVGPTMAMSGNAQGIVGYVGANVPVVFLVALAGVILIAYGFKILARHTSHAGSAYGLVGRAIGPRTGFVSGFALAGAYVALATCCGAIFAASVNSFLAQLQVEGDPYQLPWIVPALVSVGLSALLALKETRIIARVLIAVEVVGIVLMIVLAAAIVVQGGAASTGLDLSVFDISGAAPSSIFAGAVLAFLSWAGFEACASLGEEGHNPRRNIPIALIGTVIALGGLYIFVMFAQMVGFGTDAAGLAAMQSSGSTLGDLGADYLGTSFGLIIVFTVSVSAFAANLACACAAGRLVFAFARDGFGPRRLAKTHQKTGTPMTAVMVVLAFCAIANFVSWATSWPDMGTGNSAIDSYVFFAVAGSVALLVCYFTVQVAAIRLSIARRVGRNPLALAATVLVLAVGGAFVVIVLWENVKTQTDLWTGPGYWGLIWCGVGIVLALAARRTTARIGASLAREDEPEAAAAPREPSIAGTSSLE